MPSTSYSNSQTSGAAKTPDETVKNHEDSGEDDDSFTTQQLFSFAWQIARGMVTIIKHHYVVK